MIKLARFATNPSNNHITLAKRVLRYLKATKDYGIIYTNNSSNYINSYYDSDCVSNTLLTKSTLGYVFILISSLIS